jgi:undecaprenyl-diphosphatase
VTRAAGVSALLFLLLGAAIIGGLTAPLDWAVLHALRLPGQPGVAAVPEAGVRLARRLTDAGPVIVRGPLALLAALWLWRKGQGRAGTALMLASVGEELLVQLVKEIVHRPRPPHEWALVVAHSTSFPSGHAAGCMALYPLLGWFLGGLRDRRTARICAGLGVAFALMVGLTRVVLGVHWLADVGAGWLLGGTIALVAASVPPRRATA